MGHTDTVYQFVPPGVEFPTKTPPLRRALGALHGSHSASFLPLAPSLSACLLNARKPLSTVYAANRLLLSRTAAAGVHSVVAENIIATNCRAAHHHCRSHGVVKTTLKFSA